jgi:hypothetical protein
MSEHRVTWPGRSGKFELDAASLKFTNHRGQAVLDYSLIEAVVGPYGLATSGQAPELRGDVAVVNHGFITERYVPVAAGVEQFFDIPRRVGPGDMVVKIALKTGAKLLEELSSSERLVFGSGKTPAFYIGDAVAIDANGATIQAPLSWTEGVLTITVPDAWLETAAFPVVVDPVVGINFLVSDQDGATVNIPRTCDVAYNATDNEYLCVWSELTGTGLNNVVFAQRVNASTGALVGSLITIDATANFDNSDPAIAWSAPLNRYCLAYTASDTAGTAKPEAVCRILNNLGVDIGTGKIAVSDLTADTLWDGFLDVAFNGTNFLIVWAHSDTLGGLVYLDADPANVFARYVTTAGAASGASFQINAAGVNASRATVASVGTTSVVAWAQTAVITSNRDIFAAQVNGTTVSSPVQLSTSAGTDNDFPKVAGNTTNSEYLVVWDRNTLPDDWTPNAGAGNAADIVARRVSAAGAALGAEILIQSSTNNEALPDVAWSATDNNYVVVWSDATADLFTSPGADIFGARINGGADTIAQNDIQFSSGNEADFTPAIAARSGTKQLLAFWCRLVVGVEFTFHAQRFSTTVSPNPPTLSNLQQFKTDGTTQLLVGDATNETTVLLTGTLTDADVGDSLQLEAEVRPIGTAFTNLPTHAGTSVATGNTSVVTVPGLAIATGYHWQARAVDDSGNTSAWTSFGGNPEANTDFSTNGFIVGPALLSENFDTGLPGTWTVAGNGGAVTWKADALPTPVGPGPGAAFVSSPNSLNYNDDTSFNNADLANSGTATTPVIVGTGTIIVTFDCNHETEGGSFFDEMRMLMSSDNFVTTLTNNQFFIGAVSPNGCAAMGTWHTHTISVPGVAANFQIRFSFNTQDGVFNDFDGWFIDNLFVTNTPTVTDQSPGTPSGLQQRDSVATIIPVGANVTGDGTTVQFEGTLTDPDAANTLRLQVEIKPVTQAFDGSGVLTSAAVANGALATITTTFVGGNYHWRARTIDNINVPGAWVSFPQAAPNADTPLPAATDFKVNTAPLAPAFSGGGGQFRSDTVTVIAAGGATDESTVVFKAVLTDNDLGDTVRLHVEVQPSASAFTGVDAAGSPSGFVASGSLATVTVTGLAPGTYKWQAWAEDASGVLSGTAPNFTAFPPSDPDFTVLANTPPGTPTSLGQFKLDGVTGIPIGGSTTETGVVFKGTAIDPEANSWRLQVERRLTTAALTTPASPAIDNVTFFQSALVSSGSVAFITATGFANGNYHWAARAVDSAGNASAWVSFGGNTENPPTNPAATDFNVTAAAGNTPPATPTINPASATIGQFKADGTTTIAQGAITNENTVVFRGTVSDPDGNPVALQVEVVPMASAFTNSPTVTGSFVASGGNASATVSGLANNDYKWQARAIDSQGATSSWIEFGGITTDFTVLVAGNLNPASPTGLGQFKLDGATSIAVGAATNELGVIFRATVSDTDATPNSVKLQVEVAPVGQPFVNSPSTESPLVASGSVASATFNGLTNLTAYHWQVRAMDSNGAVSAWLSFPQPVPNTENPPTNPAATDFSVDTSTNTTPPDPTLLGQFRSDGITAIAAAGNTNQTTVVFKATVDGGNGDQVKLQIEVVPNAGAFSGSPTAETAFMASGTQGTVTISGLAINAYKWRARAVDLGGKTSSWTDFPPGDPDFNVVANSPPTITILAGTSPQQFLMDGATVIPAAGTTVQASFVAQAIVTDPDGDQVRLQVDIDATGVALPGTIDGSSILVASGTTIQVTVAIPAVGNWQWQVRGQDENGANGAFVEFQGGNGTDLQRLPNTAPTVTGPDQRDMSSVSVPIGGRITFRGECVATVNDADGDNVTLEVEVRPAGTAFSNVATHTASGAAGSFLIASITGLADGDYHWQYRATDINGNASAWTPFNVAAVHFTWVSDPGGSKNNLKCGLGAGSALSVWPFLLFALLAFVGKKRKA